MKTTGRVNGIISNIVIVKADGPVGQNEICYVWTGDTKMMAEVIKVIGDAAYVQVFDSTRGLKIGDRVEFEGHMLEVTLAPGLLSRNYDGLQNDLEKVDGLFIARGSITDPVDFSAEWEFAPLAKAGDKVSAASWLGEVKEQWVSHKIMVPFTMTGNYTVKSIVAAGKYKVTDTVAVVTDDEGRRKMEEILQFMADSFPQITSLMYVINNKCNDTIGDLDVEVFKGNDHIFEEMEGLRFKVGPKSFYQTNSEQAYNLYKVAREFAGLTGNELVYDLYTGTGTIANFVARQARKVVGIEYVPEAIEDAKVNSALNGIDNTLFYAGDMKDILTNDFIAEHGRPDVIITDPPRAGMHNDVIDVILAAEPKRIVYVSCNPATQARDLQLLDGKYKVTAVQPVDMFPHTHHVENVVQLERR